MTFKPGEKAPYSGQYGIISVSGKKLKKEVTVVKGKPFPPTVQKGQKYYLNDSTNNKSGKQK